MLILGWTVLSGARVPIILILFVLFLRFILSTAPSFLFYPSPQLPKWNRLHHSPDMGWRFFNYIALILFRKY